MIKTQIFLLSILFWFVLPLTAYAAEFRLESDGSIVGVGDEFLIVVTMDTQEESINAVQGEVTFPRDLLELKGIREKGSIVSLWIAEPPSFSGLTPGGYEGEGILFSLIFEAKARGAGRVAIEQGQALRNDGEGTNAELSTINYQLSIINQTPNTKPKTVDRNDTEPPEPFELRLGQAPSVFNGGTFLVFAAKDKNTGIDYYEISIAREGEAAAWEKAESPFLLEQYDEIEKIEVRAIDRAGNIQSETLVVKNSSFEFLSFRNIAILIGIGGVLIYAYWRKKRIPT